MGAWIDNILLKRVIGILVRRLIDVVAGVLLAASAPVLVSLGEWVLANGKEIEALLLAIALSLFSIIWSWTQKKEDQQKIKRLKDGLPW